MKRALITIALLASACATSGVPAPQAPAGNRSEIDGFNRALTDATLHMDNARLLSLWEDDGVSLLPGTAPLVGKKAIAAMLEKVTAQFPGAKVTLQEDHCVDVEMSADWASEWCDTHQVVDLGAGKDPFDGRGRMLLVLHKGEGGRWRIKREMWIQAG